MKAIDKISHWGDTHHPKWIDLVRVGLGLTIFIKGVEFAQSPNELRTMFDGVNSSLLSIFLINYIPFVHLAGGILIMLGLVTRAAIIFQLPILIGVVVFAWKYAVFFDLYSGFGLALPVLFLLVIFLVYGSGPLSLDERMKKHPNS